MPNRAFMCAATSQGKLGDSHVTPFTAPSIFGALGKANIAWAVYGYDAAPYTQSDFNDTLSAPAANFGLFADFKAAAAAGTLGAYSFLEPSWGRTGNSQHPNYDVSLGEQLIHDVYYVLQSSPTWNQTLLIITYDEHGGNFDHVPPPTGAAAPDGSVGDQGFDFTRFGVRVPAVLVSPLIAAGTVFRVADATTPIDHTSILKTIEVRWSLPPLTARDAAAPDLGDVLTLATPRTDDPLAGVAPPVSTGAVPDADLPSHLQRVRAAVVASLPILDANGLSDHEMPALRTGADHETYIAARMAAWNAQQRR
jgi:phospholipase C